MKFKKLVAWVILVAILAVPMMTSAAGDFVVFTELFVKRMLEADPDFQTTVLSSPMKAGDKTLVNTSAGTLSINASWDIEILFAPYDFGSKRDLSGAMKMVTTISALEYSDLQDDLLVSTRGSSAFKEASKIFDAIVGAMNENRATITAGDDVLVYKSDKYSYFASLGYDSEHNRTSAIELTIKIK